MGMYDSIDCQYPLPMPDVPKGYTGSFGFQTKDLENSLDIYIIDKDGQLSIECRDTEWVQGDPNGKSFLDKSGYLKTKKTWLEPVNKTCAIQFYNYLSSDKTDYDYWIVYNAVFIEGKIKEIKLTTFEAEPNSERKEKDEAFKMKLNLRHEFVQTWRYKYIYRHYNKALRKTVEGATKYLTKLKMLIFKLESKIQI